MRNDFRRNSMSFYFIQYISVALRLLYAIRINESDTFECELILAFGLWSTRYDVNTYYWAKTPIGVVYQQKNVRHRTNNVVCFYFLSKREFNGMFVVDLHRITKPTLSFHLHNKTFFSLSPYINITPNTPGAMKINSEVVWK